jgi:hypothetical protein
LNFISKFSKEYQKIINHHFPWLPTIFTRLNAQQSRQQIVPQQQKNMVVVN